MSTVISECPHPGCTIDLRFVSNRHTGTTALYHGEDVLVVIAGFSEAAVALDGTPERNEAVVASAEILATAVARFHLALEGT